MQVEGSAALMSCARESIDSQSIDGPLVNCITLHPRRSHHQHPTAPITVNAGAAIPTRVEDKAVDQGSSQVGDICTPLQAQQGSSSTITIRPRKQRGQWTLSLHECKRNGIMWPIMQHKHLQNASTRFSSVDVIEGMDSQSIDGPFSPPTSYGWLYR
jgi:hypothetical protein